MKHITILCAFLLLGFFAIGQTRTTNEYQTIFGDKGKVSHGGYGALTFGWGKIDDTDAVFGGMKFGWVIDHHLTLGFAGNGFVNNIHINQQYGQVNTILSGGYGGLLLEAIIAPFSPVHVSIPVIIGGGGIARVDQYYWGSSYWEPFVTDTDAYFVIEPGIELELNVVRFMRIAFGASYRHTSEVYLKNVSTDALRGFAGNLSLKFGKF